MTTVEFLAHLSSLGIQIWAEEGRLRYRAPQNALTAELRAELAARKAEILDFLAQVIRANTAQAAVIPVAPHDQPPPLSFAQERLWFVDQWAPGGSTYNLPYVVRLSGALDRAALQHSLSAIVVRHESLRTTFAEGESHGQPVQMIHPPAPVALPLIDLRALPAADREPIAFERTRAETQRPFDLRRGPLLRAALICLADDEHMLAITMHHSISDGWSTGIFTRELTALYAAAVQGEATPATTLPALPIQYADFAVWQRDQLQGHQLEQQLSYWQQQLQGAPVALSLPTDRPRPARQTFNGGVESIQIPPELAGQLTALSQREDVTLFMILLAAFQSLLYRYSGQDDLVVGSPVSGRTHTEIEGLIGCFVNMIALRADLRGNPGFRQLLRQTREVTLQAYAHQSLPFERVVEALQPVRSLSHTPIFQVVFMLQHATATQHQLPGLTLAPVPLEHTTAKFDLDLSLSESPQGLWAALEYNSDLFDQPTIARLLRHYCMLLQSIVADPDQRIGELGLLSDAEWQQLRAWQGDQLSYPVTESLHVRFEGHAARSPDAIALICEDQSLTYAELNARANQLAAYLREQHLARTSCAEPVVALYLARSLDLVVAVLGILKAGAAYLPLDPVYPAERVAMILEDAQATAVLTHSSLRERLPDQSRAIVCLDADWPQIAQQPASNPDQRCSPDQLAYIIYTSGSTGRPKGVLITHGHVVRLFDATERWFAFDERDVWTLFHSIAFDFSVWELWGALLYGGRLVVVPYLVSRTPEAFYDLLRQERVTVLNQTPSAFRQLIQAEHTLDGQPDDLALRLVIFGGEALDLPSLRPWFARHGDTRPQLVNMYGITETTVHVTYRPLRSADLDSPATSLIGGPIPDLRLYVLDPAGQPVPVGVIGELYVGGAGVARGYLNRPDLTAERFVPNPWAEPGRAPSGRLYRSGDLARYTAAGDLQYLGRIDHQVKVRGFRIELGEIEAVLLRHPGIREALVLPYDEPAPAGNAIETRLVVYVVKNLDWRTQNLDGEQKNKEGTTVPPRLSQWERGLGGEGLTNNWDQRLTVTELRDFLKQQLPEYMVPSLFTWLAAFPLTPNGKLDRRALPDPSTAERPALTSVFVAPRTRSEQLLAEAWGSVLGIQRIGIHDHFFSLGGDSIRSLQIVSAARTRGLEISLVQIFEHPTIAELAAVATPIEAAGEPWSEAMPPPFGQISPADRELIPGSVEDAYPLSALQSGMLFHSAASDAGIYHDQFSFHVRVPFDLTAIREAAQQLVARHPVLRTSFDLSSYSQPLQLVHRAVTMPLEVVDLQALTTEAQEAALLDALHTERNRPFVWTQPPLLRLAVYRRSEASFQLLLSCHHAIIDGWSVALLISELVQLYQAHLHHQPPRLVSPGQSFHTFVALEQQALADPRQIAYWQAALEDSIPTLVPRWQPPRPEADQHSFRRSIILPQDVVDGLHALTQSLDVPLKSALLAAHLRVLSLLSGQRDVTTGMVVNGRPESEEGARTMGLFLNTIPLRLRLAGGTWRDLVQATYMAERDILPYRRFPMARLQQILGRAPFETAFNFVHFHILQQLHQESQIEILSGSSFARTNFPLAASAHQDPLNGQIHIDLDYDPTQIQPAQIEAYCGYYRRALNALAQQPLARYEQISLLATDEQHQLLHDWNATDTALPAHAGVHELIADVAARWPSTVAVAMADPDTAYTPQLTYAELNTRANQLAGYLRQRGVGTSGECVIALYLEPSPELIVAILGVLKAGAAYLPLDPSYPPARIQHMLHDARSRMLLTMADLAASIPPHPGVTLCLDRDWPSIAASPTSALSPALPSQLVYLIYTSGSTGQPRGVMVTHQSLAARAVSMSQQYGLDRDDRVLQLLSFSFDSASELLFSSLVSGATVVLSRHGLHLAPADVLTICERDAINAINLPAAYWHQLVTALLQTQRDVPAGLRVVTVGGESPAPALLNAWAERVVQPMDWINAYGPTEATVVAAIHKLHLSGTALDLPAVIPFGRPIANTQLYVLDAAMQPVPIGALGELFIGGVGVARGYLNQPALTADKFVPDPFSQTPGARLYRTGDLVRWLPDGTLEFAGRSDEQVKLRGYRIELGEIERALLEHPAVQQCTVVVRNLAADGIAHQRIVAYVVAEQKNKRTKEQRTKNKEQESTVDSPSPTADAGQTTAPGVEIPPSPVATEVEADLGLGKGGQGGEGLNPSNLRAFLQKRLPGYMIPASIVSLPTLPLTPNGKLDRAALPEPQDIVEADEQRIAPRDAWELRLARLWQALLQTSVVGVTDDFFQSGGDSLLAVQLMTRIEHEFGQRIPLAALISGATIAQIAARLREQPLDGPSSLVALQPHGTQAPFFCVHAIGGHVLAYRNLSQRLGADQPFYGLQARGLDDDQPPCTDVPTLAEHYLQAIRAVQPHGPYRLGGWSFGGVVAFEMAQQLQHQGETVELLALIDSVIARDDEPPSSTDALRALAWDLGNIFGQPLIISADELAGRDQEAQLSYILAQGQQRTVLPADLSLEQIRRYFAVFHANLQAAYSYVAQPYSGPMLLFQAGDAPSTSRQRHAAAWRALANGGLTVETLPGDHYAIVRLPTALADRLSFWLEQPSRVDHNS